MAGYPYIMQSSVISADLAGTVFVPEERVFRNTTPQWLRVHRIGLHARAKAGNSGTRNSRLDAMRPSWAIRFGHTEVTNGFVPMAAVTWRPNVDEPAAVVDFAQPVYLAPNDRLDVRIKYAVNDALGAGFNDLFLAARCSTVDRPDAIRVPALFGWEGLVRGGNSGSFSEDVPVHTLYNEFDEVMHVERIIGRLGLFAGDPAAKRVYPSVAQVLVDLSLQDGAKITRDPTPMAALFDLARQSWLTNIVLPAKGYIQANVSGNLVDAGTPVNYFPYIGMLGYRTIG